jgi:hypothetical protein
VTRPTKGTPEHRAWVISCIVEAARRAGREVARMTRDRVTLHREERDEHWPCAGDYEALGGWARSKAAAVLELDVPSGDPTPDVAELGERRGVQRDLLHARRLERIVGDREHWTDTVARIVVAGIEARPATRVLPAAPPRPYDGEREVVVLLSDLHYGQRIDSREVPGSRYGWTEAARRTAYVVREAASYKPAHREHTTCRLLLGGDIIEGEIHGPTREADALAAQLDGARQILTHAIAYLRESFSRVDVVCTSGNHGRWPHAQGRAVSSKWDGAVTVLYRALEAVFAHDRGVTWTIPRTPYATWRAPGGAVCALTHGDTVVSAGQPGRTVHTHRIADQLRRWNSARAAQGDEPIRALALGHYHVPMRVSLDDGLDVVVNGCLGGTAAYAQGAYGVHGSRPSQVIWESTARHPVGDLRVVEVGRADDDPSLDAICPPVVAIGEAA